MKKLELNDQTRVMVLTGAGVSAESGIPTFRGTNGLWKNNPVEEVASPAGFAKDSDLVWDFYSERRQKAVDAAPNPAHFAIQRLEEELGERFLLVTQNVDGLHYKAGSKRVVELHGNLFRTKCSTCTCPYIETDRKTYERTPSCGQCGSKLRPDIVWFGEMIPQPAMSAVRAFIFQATTNPLIFIAVGTSGVVQPASMLGEFARALGAKTILVNAEEADNEMAFDEVYRGQAGTILPQMM